ncbi:hypothetical protein TRL7639_03557 [Falsiruegeria litorea R37]|uniref:DUF1214 domain-containing protein n=1 Tax=Falsiruegeria litorea R37 TaxID=1200284 RepID=A0A1Y5TG76_9RHOB|nr:DUF1214 domain-containing protein [Falsiruegeria litorea]SLN63264.1 hypothetical protein TRL7639_03557 [Falsiruegeria litorea R37]
MGRSLIVVAGILVGGFIGGVSALIGAGLISGPITRAKPVQIEGWESDWTIGSDASDPYLRAWVARYGLLALRKTEAVYFIADTDSDGNPLADACTYRVSGGAMPGFWWSVTLYDADGYLPLNEGMHLSFDATDVEGAENWSFDIAGTKPSDPGQNWVSSKHAGLFDLTLRIYEPEPVFLDAPTSHLAPPKVQRLTCRGDA